MNKNIKIAKELMKIAKNLIVSSDYNDQDYNDQDYINEVKNDDGFSAIGIINNHEQVIDSGTNKNQIIKQSQKELHHYDSIEIYSRGKLIKTIK